MNSQPITRRDFENMLMAQSGATFMTIRAVTEVRIPGGIKTLNGKVFKCSDVLIQTGVNYTNAVNNQREREGGDREFHAQPRKWGERVKHADGRLTPFVSHKGAVYLEAKVVRSLAHSYTIDRDGVITSIPNETVDSLLVDSRPAAQATQGVEKAVILRDYNLENVRQVTVGGITYDLIR